MFSLWILVMFLCCLSASDAEREEEELLDSQNGRIEYGDYFYDLDDEDEENPDYQDKDAEDADSDDEDADYEDEESEQRGLDEQGIETDIVNLAADEEFYNFFEEDDQVENRIAEEPVEPPIEQFKNELLQLSGDLTQPRQLDDRDVKMKILNPLVMNLNRMEQQITGRLINQLNQVKDQLRNQLLDQLRGLLGDQFAQLNAQLAAIQGELNELRAQLSPEESKDESETLKLDSDQGSKHVKPTDKALRIKHKRAEEGKKRKEIRQSKERIENKKKENGWKQKMERDANRDRTMKLDKRKDKPLRQDNDKIYRNDSHKRHYGQQRKPFPTTNRK